MKRTSLFAILLLTLSVASMAQAQPRAAQADPTAEITRLERLMFEYWKTQKYDDMKAQMAANAVFVSANGIHDRQGELAGLRKDACQVRSFSLTDIKVSVPSPGVALIVYHVTSDGVCGGKPIPSAGFMTSSLWVRQGTRWMTVFHQQAPVPQ